MLGDEREMRKPTTTPPHKTLATHQSFSTAVFMLGACEASAKPITTHGLETQWEKVTRITIVNHTIA
jgi:hypothetical protein